MGQVVQDVMQTVAEQSRYQEVLLRVHRVMETKPRDHRDLLAVCSHPFTLAQQLTHIELVRTVPSSDL